MDTNKESTRVKADSLVIEIEDYIKLYQKIHLGLREALENPKKYFENISDEDIIESGGITEVNLGNNTSLMLILNSITLKRKDYFEYRIQSENLEHQIYDKDVKAVNEFSNFNIRFFENDEIISNELVYSQNFKFKQVDDRYQHIPDKEFNVQYTKHANVTQIVKDGVSEQEMPIIIKDKRNYLINELSQWLGGTYCKVKLTNKALSRMGLAKSSRKLGEFPFE